MRIGQWLGIGWVAASLSLTAGNFSAELSNRGVMLSNGVMTPSLFSRVLVVDPEWNHRFFSEKSPVEFYQDGNRKGLKSPDVAAECVVQDYSVACDGDEAQINLEVKLNTAEKTVMEYTALVFATSAIAGSGYVAELADGSTVTGVISREFKVPSDISQLIPPARKLVFTDADKYGELTIEVVEGIPFELIDRRSNWYERHECFLLLGTGEMKNDENFVSKINVRYRRLPGDLPAPLSPSAAPVQQGKVDAVTRAESLHFPLLPQPKELHYAEGSFAVPQNLHIAVKMSGIAAEDEARLYRAAARLFAEEAGVVAEAGADARVVLRRNEAITRPEEYTLAVTPEEIVIEAATARGAFYGLQSLRGLMRDGVIPAVTMRDWPDMEFRGIQLLMDDYSDVFHSELIEKVLAPAKINHLVMEIEYAKWDATAGLHMPHAISKEQLKQVIAVARENFIDVSPLFQTLGHCEWLFKDGSNLDMAEDVGYPYAYNVSHPEVYPLMTRIMDEILELFGDVPYLHIGHDEVTIYLNFPMRPENKALGLRKIIEDDVMFYHDYAQKHNLRLMMWHDMFATWAESPENGQSKAPSHLAELRRSLPKDIIFAIWRYNPQAKEFADIEAFQRDGFEVLACPWFDPVNIQNLAVAAKKNQIKGMLQTTWTGYFGNEKALRQEYHQLAPYLLTASWSWNADPAANQYDAYRLLGELLRRDRKAAPPEAGFTVDLSAAANLDGKMPVLGDEALERALVRFQPSVVDGRTRSVTVFSRMAPAYPAHAVIDFASKAQELFFLQTTGACSQKPGELVGNWLVKYADGGTVEIPVRYGWEIGAPQDNFSHALSSANVVEDASGRYWWMRWENPYPEKVIQSLTMTGTAAEYPFTLLALSGVGK